MYEAESRFFWGECSDRLQCGIFSFIIRMTVFFLTGMVVQLWNGYPDLQLWSYPNLVWMRPWTNMTWAGPTSGKWLFQITCRGPFQPELICDSDSDLTAGNRRTLAIMLEDGTVRVCLTTRLESLMNPVYFMTVCQILWGAWQLQTFLTLQGKKLLTDSYC